MKVGNILKSIPISELLFSKEDIEYYNEISYRELIFQLFQALYLLCSAYMIWMTISLVLKTEAPIVVVLSESMHPGFNRGDILLLGNLRNEYYSGDICVFQMKKKEIPIVHRVVEKTSMKLNHHSKSLKTDIQSINHYLYMTKGDNNKVDDTFIYKKIGVSYISNDYIKSIVYGSFPIIGMITITTGSFAGLKYLIIFIIFLDIVFSRGKLLDIQKTNDDIDEKETSDSNQESKKKEINKSNKSKE